LDRRGGRISIEGTDAVGKTTQSLLLVLHAAPEGLVSKRPGLEDSYEKDSELQARAQTLYKELAPKFGWMTPIDGSRSVGLVHDSVVQTVKDGLDLRVRRGRPKDSRP
jgi:thymidylate kinase